MRTLLALLATVVVLDCGLARAAENALTIPDVAVVDQNGQPRRFHDVIRGKAAAVNFIFTSCTTICSPLGANFESVQKLLGTDDGVALISISLDPTGDTPRRLKDWGARFHAGPNWMLLTGQPSEIERLLRAFRVYTADRVSHAPVVVVGSLESGTWTRGNGLAAPATIASMVRGVPRQGGTTALQGQATRKYFGEVELVNQDGQTMRLYSDLLKGKIVVINSFFASCPGSCPVMANTFGAIQDRLAERLGKDLLLISISVDPEKDTPAVLSNYARKVKARPGWVFLTGSKENVGQALRKLGQFVEQPSDHLNVIIVGNERTGLWKKAFGLAKPQDVITVVESVLNDRG